MFHKIIDTFTPQRVKDARSVRRANKVLHLVLVERQQMSRHNYTKDAA